MWLGSIASAIFAASEPLSGSAFQVFAKICLQESAEISGPVTDAGERAKTAALAQRERLIADLREAKRQHKSTRKIRKALCSATNEALGA